MSLKLEPPTDGDRALSELKTLGRHSGDVWAVAITPDGLKAISVSSDQTLKLWDERKWGGDRYFQPYFAAPLHPIK